jgi:peptidoglycan/xylan/chitin deacetylase (PgdA/CDA1 family)
MATQKQFIIKADDYGRGGANLDPWRRFIDCALDEYLTLSIGVVGGELRNIKSVSPYLRSIVEEYDIEIWNHSNTHPNFIQLNQEEILQQILDSQKTIENELGLRPTIFGPPFNKIDQDSASHVIESNEFDGYYAFDGVVDRAKNIELKYFSGLEVRTDAMFPVRPDIFDAELIRKGSPDFLVLQVHPYYWSIECFKAFKKIMSRLKEFGYISTTAKNRLLYWANKIDGANPYSIGNSLGENLLHEERLIEYWKEKNATEGHLHPTASEIRFLINAGTSSLHQFYRSIGLNNAPLINGKLKIVDIYVNQEGGAAAAAALLPNASVESINGEKHIYRYFFDKTSIEKEVFINANNQNFNFKNESCSVIISNNVINYRNIQDEFSMYCGALRFSGMALVSSYNRLYPLSKVRNAINEDRLELALMQLDSLIKSDGAKVGFLTEPEIQYWNFDEMRVVGISNGLKLQRKFLLSPVDSGSYLGKPTSLSMLYVKTQKAAEIRGGYVGGELTSNMLNRINEPLTVDLNAFMRDISSNFDEINLIDIKPHELHSFEKIVKRYGFKFDSHDINFINKLIFYCNIRANNFQLVHLPIRPHSIYIKLCQLHLSLIKSSKLDAQKLMDEIEEYIETFSIDDLSFWL